MGVYILHVARGTKGDSRGGGGRYILFGRMGPNAMGRILARRILMWPLNMVLTREYCSCRKGAFMVFRVQVPECIVEDDIFIFRGRVVMICHDCQKILPRYRKDETS